MTKAVRGCLSELFNGSGNGSGVDAQPPLVFETSVHQEDVSDQMENEAQNVPLDVCAELDLIFSCMRSTEHNVLPFGFSPPVRSSNPLCRDSRFQKQLKSEKEVDIFSSFLHV